jgi:hypothetical protein
MKVIVIIGAPTGEIIAQTRSEYKCVINLVHLHHYRTHAAGGTQIGGV